MAVWGFNARWLPVFLGIREPSSGGLLRALAASAAGLATALLGQFQIATLFLLLASISATVALNIFGRPLRAAKTLGVSRSFPAFVRGAYVWLVAAACLGVYAARAEGHGGCWGASRHALTGFLATMVFATGQRVLPGFCSAASSV